MSSCHDNARVDDAFYQPLSGLVATSPHLHRCPGYSDEDGLLPGIRRVLEEVGSGRAFLQEHGPGSGYPPTRADSFEALASGRRRDLAIDVDRRLLAAAAGNLPDRLAHIPELERYECFAVDGHRHGAATHDARHEGSKMPVGHFYSLDLRGHPLRHLAAAEGLHEHDMSVPERLKPRGLRHAVPKGRRVLVVYDKAGIDFDFWKRCRHECAVYFISRVKEGMVHDSIASLPARQDPRDHGVTDDRRVQTRDGHPLRIIRHTAPETGQTYEFLTNDHDLPAGVVTELYRRRWDVEKVFDDLKNKLGEQQAWATSLVAKTVQGQRIALTHDLMLLYEARIEREHGLRNTAEDHRRSQRTAERVRLARQAGRPISSLLLAPRRATQRSVKFLRWLRHALREQLAETIALPRLAHLYASL